MAPPPQPLDPAVLIDEIVEEFLLRLSPDDPAFLARVALVSRQWYRVVTGPSFRRRFRELHRSTPPLLGYIDTLADTISFVPLSSFRPPRAHRRGVRAVSSSHGRVLLHRLSHLYAPRVPVKDAEDVHLSVWHSITDEQQDLPVVPVPTRYQSIANWDAAVVCAGGDGCDHLHCHFRVVFVGRLKGRDFSYELKDRDFSCFYSSEDLSCELKDRDFSCFYSSEAGSWSDPVFAGEESKNTFVRGEFIPIGTALYTVTDVNKILKYDMQTHEMCKISTTPEQRSGRLIAAEDGRLGFAMARNSTLSLWLWDNGTWEERRAIDLHTLLPADALRSAQFIVAFADTGAGVVFFWTRVGYFTIDLKCGRCKKIGEVSSGCVVPFVSFCTPAPGAGVAISADEVPVAAIAVSTDDGPGAGVAISSDEVPVAAIAVSTDDGPGAGVAVSADEGPAAAGICQPLRSSNYKCKGL